MNLFSSLTSFNSNFLALDFSPLTTSTKYRTRYWENEFEVIDFMPRFKKENGKYYTPPEIVRILKLKKGSPIFKVLYDPRLAFASGNTKTYKKENFIVSIVDDEKYETLFLYSNLDKEAIINSSEITLNENIYFVISYNEKINLPNIDKVE